MSTIKSSNEHLTFNADSTAKEIRFQADGTQKASISSAGLFTSTTIDATVLTGALPAISGASLTNLPSTSTADILTATTIQKTATSNIGLGANAVDSITTGDYNVGLGANALTACTTGANTTAVGYAALTSLTSAQDVTAVGFKALYSNTTGGSNTYKCIPIRAVDVALVAFQSNIAVSRIYDVCLK